MTGRGRAARHVLVTDAGRGSAVAFIRSLGARGWRVTAADADRWSPGFRSRHATDRLVYPHPFERTDAMVDAIVRAVRRTGVDLVVPITDDVGLPIAAARDAFPAGTILAIPDDAALAAARDKEATLGLAERLGIPVPPTRIVATAADAHAAAAELGWPVVVKPRVSRQPRPDGTLDAFRVEYAVDHDELDRRMHYLAGRTTVLLQRWLPGEGLGVELLLDRGRPLAAFQHRRLREVPVTGGASSLRESVALDTGLYGDAVRLLGELCWTGLAMVEFRRSPDGAHLMEINGRVWGSMPLAVRAGMDFPARLADLLLDGPPPAGASVATDYRIGVRARNLQLDVGWIAAVVLGRRRYPYLGWPPRAAALRAAVGLLDPRVADDLFLAADPGPGLAQLPLIVRGAIAKGAAGGT